MDKAIITVMHGSRYGDNLLHLLGSLNGKKTAMVSLGKRTNIIRDEMRKKGVVHNELVFLESLKTEENSINIKSSNSLMELSLGIRKALSANSEVIVFDSLTLLSRLRGYNTNQIIRFANHVVEKVHENNASIIFTCIEDDADSEVVRGMLPVIDKFIEYEGKKIDYVIKRGRRPVYAAYGLIATGGFALLFFGSQNLITGHAILDLTNTMQIPAIVGVVGAILVVVLALLVTQFHRRLDTGNLL